MTYINTYYVKYLYVVYNYINSLVKKSDYYNNIFGTSNIESVKNKLDNIIDGYIILNYIFKMSIGYNEYYDIPVTIRNVMINKLTELREKEYKQLKSDYNRRNK